MGGQEDTVIGFHQGNEGILSTNSLPDKVSEMAMSSVSIAKSSDGINPFLGSGWDPLVSLSQPPTFGGSSMVSHTEFDNSSYPVAHYMSESNFIEIVPKLSGYGSGCYSNMVGSFCLPECGELSNIGYRSNYNVNKEGGIERASIKAVHSNDEVGEEGAKGSGPNGNKRKRAGDSNSPFSPNKSTEVEAPNVSSGKSSDLVKEQSEKKLRFEPNGGRDVRGKQTAKQTKDDSHSGEAAPKENFIHVRARRGQATNSHSLAERVRREKISERMRLLQELVPGCNKITGKAVMLDEIINYVQSLQQQVEFLSMKLATVNPELNFDIDRILSKDILHPRIGNSAMLGYNLGITSTHPFPQGSLPTIPSTTAQFASLPPTGIGNEFQSLFQMGFDSSTATDNFGLNGRLKTEL